MKTLTLTLVALLAGCGGSMDGSSTAPPVPMQVPQTVGAAPTVPTGLTTAPAEKYAAAVFMGDSITYQMHVVLPDADHNAGVPSDTTAMMRARFQADALAYNPSAVVILGGINDIRMEYGTDVPLTNVAAMAQQASASGACVILGLLLPTEDHSWTDKTQLSPADGDALIAEYNQKLRGLGAVYGYRIANYHDAFVLPDGTPNTALMLPDGLHENDAGAQVMWQVVEPQLAECGVPQ